MKLKIMALLMAMLLVVAMFASCKKEETPGDENAPGTSDNGNENKPGNSTDEGKDDPKPNPSTGGKKDILVQLYENDNNGELSSGLKRYYAGQDSAGVAEIDQLVRERNTAAVNAANVKVTYSYETTFGWGASVDKIQDLAKSGSASSPDIFANFAYDMTSCALRGCFANLLSNTAKAPNSTYGNGTNPFAFAQDGYVGTSDQYFDSNAGQGYFFDYMQSLAFANENGVYDKMYCLASNYCVDAVRSFLVVPVNMEMLESIAVNASTGDRDNDTDFDVEDFYDLVWDYGWTYEALAKLSKAVYNNTNTAVSGADIKDKLGFCAGKSSGLTASGILYTTSVKIINKVERDGKVTYEYPAENADLVALAVALEKLFKNSDGVCTLSSEDAKNQGLGEVKGDLDGIRNQFAKNMVLFGGVIAVGSLEDSVYSAMNAPGMKGFGVVPVPLYKQTATLNEEGNPDEEAEDFQQYQTLVHNLARIVAISVSTTEFEECAKFLDYQSQNSAEILEMYYTDNLVAAVDAGNAAKHNVNMLNYIRNHVRDCFDKTYEDVISNYQGVTDENASTKRWHGIFYSNGYVVTNMAQRYREESPAKQASLETVLEEWSKLK